MYYSNFFVQWNNLSILFKSLFKRIPLNIHVHPQEKAQSLNSTLLSHVFWCGRKVGGKGRRKGACMEEGRRGRRRNNISTLGWNWRTMMDLWLLVKEYTIIIWGKTVSMGRKWEGWNCIIISENFFKMYFYAVGIFYIFVEHCRNGIRKYFSPYFLSIKNQAFGVRAYTIWCCFIKRIKYL